MIDTMCSPHYNIVYKMLLAATLSGDTSDGVTRDVEEDTQRGSRGPLGRVPSSSLPAVVAYMTTPSYTR